MGEEEDQEEEARFCWGLTDLDSGQHAGGGHAEVQIGQAVGVGGLIESWRLLLWQVVCRANRIKQNQSVLFGKPE